MCRTLVGLMSLEVVGARVQGEGRLEEIMNTILSSSSSVSSGAATSSMLSDHSCSICVMLGTVDTSSSSSLHSLGTTGRLSSLVGFVALELARLVTTLGFFAGGIASAVVSCTSAAVTMGQHLAVPSSLVLS